MLRHYVGNRKKGHIFINMSTRQEADPAAFQEDDRQVGQAAEIQRLQSIKLSSRAYHLIALIGLRKAGGRHHDLQWW